MPDILYHCMPHAMEGEEIRPSTGYGSSMPPEVAAQLGIAPDDKIPLVFASDHKSKALAFGFSYARDEICGNGSLDGDCEYALIPNRDAVMTAPRAGTLYAFSAENFVQAFEKQFVSPLPVPVAETREVMKIHSVEDMMRAGLQVLSYAGDADALRDARERLAAAGVKGWFEQIAAMTQSGALLWENQARGIQPHPALQSVLESTVVPQAIEKKEPEPRKGPGPGSYSASMKR